MRVTQPLNDMILQVNHQISDLSTVMIMMIIIMMVMAMIMITMILIFIMIMMIMNDYDSIV